MESFTPFKPRLPSLEAFFVQVVWKRVLYKSYVHHAVQCHKVRHDNAGCSAQWRRALGRLQRC